MRREAPNFRTNNVKEFLAITLWLTSFSFTFVVFFTNVVREFFIEVGLLDDTVGFDDFLDTVETLFANTTRRGHTLGTVKFGSGTLSGSSSLRSPSRTSVGA